MTNEIPAPPAAGTAGTSGGNQPSANPVHDEGHIHEHDDDDADALPHDEEASYCSTTSEESLAHSDADDEDDDEADEAGDTIASPSRTSSARRTVRTPSFSYDDLARRPRSNPRTRTPLRNPSPLLQGLRREQQHVAAAAAEATNVARNLPGMPSPQMRPAPQDAGSAAESVSSPQAQPQPQPQPQRVTIRLSAGLPVGTLPSSSSAAGRASATRRHAHAQSNATRSTKQGPSRRKVRRWTNDSMRSIAADLARSDTRGGRAAADVYARGVADGELRREYEMPNAPRNYRSSFDVLTRLVDRWELADEGGDGGDDNDGDDGDGAEDNDGVDDGEVNPAASSSADPDRGSGDRSNRHKKNNARKKKELERKQRKRAELLAARDKFLRGETAAASTAPVHSSGDNISSSSSSSRFASGPAMFRHLDPRIRSIVTRAVTSSASSSSTTTSSSSSYAARLLNAMEDLLVHRKMASDESRALVDEILARPLVVDASSGGDAAGNEIKGDRPNKEGKKKKKDKNNSKKKNRVGGVAYRFHFEAATTNNSTAGKNSAGKNAGFYRLLLHGVCQFHGMNASSSTCSYHTNTSLDEKTTAERVLTVTGTCRGREYRIVDEARKYVLEES